jgi:hypothetical protein
VVAVVLRSVRTGKRDAENQGEAAGDAGMRGLA